MLMLTPLNLSSRDQGPGGGGSNGGFPGSSGGSGGPLVGLAPIQVHAKNHALLCSIGFLVLLPFGTLVARYTRTFTRRWFWAHAIIQLVISGPVIFTGWGMGYSLCNDLGFTHFSDPHQKMALSLLILYISQLVIGIFIHYVKIPTLGAGRRPFQNYFHGFLGLVILALAASQVHYGIVTEWKMFFGNSPPVPAAAMRAWIALVVVFWALYFIGLSLLFRQFRKERESKRLANKQDGVAPDAIHLNPQQNGNHPA